MKKDQHFSEVLPLNPHQSSAMNLLWSLQHLKTPTCVLQHSKTQSLFKKELSKTGWKNACIEYY